MLCLYRVGLWTWAWTWIGVYYMGYKADSTLCANFESVRVRSGIC
jgi:hypothetical protein